MAQILIVDDDQMLCEMLELKLLRYHHQVRVAHSLAEARSVGRDTPFDLIFLDVKLPDGNGLQLLPELKARPSRPEIMIITGYGDLESAEQAIKNGAWCYLEKGSMVKEMMLPLTRALQYRAEKIRASSAAPALIRDKIVGSSPPLSKCLKLLASAAGSDLNVLLTGETGTGKEIFARAIHQNSKRRGGNFVVVDCAALPENLVESILFGHGKGAFTGADCQRKGLLQHAHGGTLFLDEVGELPLGVQKTFLRALQDGRFRPVGMAEEQESDFRLLAATHRDLEQLVAEGRFRQDLLFRLQALHLPLPPLRERGEDVVELANYFIELLAQRYGYEQKIFSPDFFEALTSYPWPGNVRELFHALERVVAVAIHSPTIYSRHLPEAIRIHLAQAPLVQKESSSHQNFWASSKADALPPWQDFKRESEQQYLHQLMLAAERNVSQACSLSGLSRARLYQLLQKYPTAGL